MAITIPLEKINDYIKEIIQERCIIKPCVSQYVPDPKPIECLATNINEGLAYLPLGIWKEIYDIFPMRTWPRANIECKKTLYTTQTDPTGKQRDQDVVAGHALQKLEEDHRVFIAAATGYGKTSIGNYLACHLKMKTAVLCHIDKVNEQWVEEFNTHSTAKVQRIKGTNFLDPNADVYIIGVQKASKLDRAQLAHIGTVIVDEAHIATLTAFSRSLLRFQPKYVIGMSATPERSDGLQKLITMYFGPRKGFIVREEVKDFTVYKVETIFKPEVRYILVNGVHILYWVHFINSLAYNLKRQEYIVNLILSKPEHRILVLSDRQNECNGIVKKLSEAGEDSVLLMTGETNTAGIDTKNYRVIVAGMKKGGVGFNDPTLTMLILATDKKDVKQMEGRIRTTNNIIYDLVDANETLERHWETREQWYRKRGAEIEVIRMPGRVLKKKGDSGIPQGVRFLKENK